MNKTGIKIVAVTTWAAVAISALLLSQPSAAGPTTLTSASPRLSTPPLSRAVASPVAFTSPSSAPRPTIGHPSKHLLAAPMHGRAALQALGGQLTTAAVINGRTPPSLRKLLTSDPTMWLSRDGQLFVREALPTAADAAAAQTTSAASAAAPFPLTTAATFSLHSDPGSQRTIYLDFVGATIPAGTFWTGVPVGTYAPWSIDTDPAFSTAELADIQEVWQRVTEHYAAFNVDVTTQAPSEAALVRTSAADQTYGVRVLFANVALDGHVGYVSTGAAWSAICNQVCAGVASLGTIARLGSTATDEHFQPAWVFTKGLGGHSDMAFPKWMADDAAHEVGHTFGLTHQGAATKPCPGSTTPAGCNYFDGFSGTGTEPQSWLWGPIMGDPYSAAISQWARGEYTDANNAQDEVATIAQRAPLRAPSAGMSKPTAVALPSSGAKGVITSSADHEFYSLGTCSGAVSVTGAPATLGPDANVQLTLLDSSGAAVSSQTSHPALTLDPGSTWYEPLAWGMSDTVSTSGASGQYYLEVSGGGSYAEGASGATDPTSGFSSYGSVGAYSLSGASGCTPVATPPSQPTRLQLNAGCGGQVLTWKPPADSGNAPITRYEAAVDSRPWTSLGTATTAVFPGIGSGHTYSVRAVNSAGTGPASSATFPGAAGNLTVQYDPTNSTSATDVYLMLWAAPTGGGPLVTEGYALSSNPTGLSGSTTSTGVEIGVSTGAHPAIIVTPFNAAGSGTGTSIVLQSGATASTGSAPIPAPYTGTPRSTCSVPLPSVVPSVPRYVHLVRGPIGGALTTIGSWTAPAVARPAVAYYQVLIVTRNRYGRIIATRYMTTTRLNLSIGGVAGYTYRIQVRAHNTKGWSVWSVPTVWVAPR